MLLVIDVGNTNTVLGIYQRTAGFKSGEDKMSLRADWRVATIRTQTVDEYGVLFHNLFSMQAVAAGEVKGIIVSSVVPPLDSTVREVCEKYFQVKPLFIEPGVKTGMPVRYENPADVGADRIVNGVAAVEKFRRPRLVGGFGTATTLHPIS